MPRAFREEEIEALLRRVQRQVDTTLASGIYDAGVWDQLRLRVVDFGVENLVLLYENTVQDEVVRKRGVAVKDIPAILPTVLERYSLIWTQQINNAFAQARDSATAGIRSIYSRVGKIVRERTRDIALVRWTGFDPNSTKNEGRFRLIDPGQFEPDSFRSFEAWPFGSPLPAGIRVIAGRIKGSTEWAAQTIRFDRGTGITRLAAGIVPHAWTEDEAEDWWEANRHRFRKTWTWNDTRPIRLGEAPTDIYGAVRASRNLQRLIAIPLIRLLRLLFSQTPRNMHRDLLRLIVVHIDKRTVFMLTGGVTERSCKTCRWAQGKVFDENALTFLTSDRRLRTNVFHPNCRHRLTAAPEGREVWTLSKTFAAAEREKLLR